MDKLFNSLQDLPMYNLLTDIIDHLDDGGVALISSETGSGKSLLTPAAIYDAWGEQVLICEPSRLLTMNAASNISEITETQIGDFAGYSVGIRGREDHPTVREDTPLVFETYGMALASQSILDAQTIVLDEAHDPRMDVTVAEAIVKAHMQGKGEPLKRLVIMSATMNVNQKLEYWKDFNPKLFTVETGLRYKCDLLWEPATRPEEAVLKLIDLGKTGILVFAPGVGEIQTVEQNLRDLLLGVQKRIEILTIHGGSESAERALANAMPEEGVVRVLLGTNVMESGISFPWADSGVSLGLAKENYVARESGVTLLQTVPLTRSNLQQQTGRTNRFCDSVFILCGNKAPKDMLASPTPEILRVPLTTLHMKCASIGVDPSEFDFLPSPDPQKLKDAVVTLQRLGFLDKEHNLTPAGEFALNLPVGLETAALLWHAKTLNILPEALRLACVFEVAGIRKDSRRSHQLDTTSDYLDGMIAYAIAETIQMYVPRHQRADEMEAENIGKKKFDTAVDVMTALERSLGIKNHLPPEMFIPSEEIEGTEELFEKLRQCILAATIDHLGHYRVGFVFMAGNSLNTYRIGSSSATADSYESKIVSATLRVITPKDPMKRPFTVAENVTMFSVRDIVAFSKTRPDVFSCDALDGRSTQLCAFGISTYFIANPEEVLLVQEAGLLPKESILPKGNLGSILQDAFQKSTPKSEKPAPSLVESEVVKLPSPPTKKKTDNTPVDSKDEVREKLLALRAKFKGE